MALSPRLEFRQSQSLVMTPQLMQAIKLLQFSTTDLAAYIEDELEKNPMLQRADDQPETGANDTAAPLEQDSSAQSASTEEGFVESVDDNWINQPLETSSSEIAATFDTDAENVFPEDAARAGYEASTITGRDTMQMGISGGMGDNEFNLEAFVGENVSLHDHLERQIGLIIDSPQDMLIAQTLIDSIDPAGYLRADIDDLITNLNTEKETITGIIEKLQTLDPPGVCARDLGECLAIQLRDKNRLDPAMMMFLENLQLLANREFDHLQDLCGVDREDLIEMVAEIKALNPRPGDAFDNFAAEPVVPDVIVQQRPDSSWAIELNTDTLPKVLVDQHYFATASSHAHKDEEKTYLSECFQTANWLVKSLDQRARTILKVSTEIVRQQDAFLTHGIAHLKPLNLRTIADAIGMHESTVSRVTSNKYMMTPRGVFELKYFFTSAISSSDGGAAHSAEAVRHRIRALIDAEDPKKTLSDDKIVEILVKDGIDIARRTVAKYREAMKIPSSVQRRREKKATL